MTDVHQEKGFSQNEDQFWKFVDSFVESPDALQEFCRQRGHELKERIASGGFGSVYRIQNSFTGEHLALKVLHFASRDPKIHTLFYCKNDQVYADIEVEVIASIEDILRREKAAIDKFELLPFLVEANTILREETVLYPHLVKNWLPEDVRWLVGEISFLPGLAETWLAEHLYSHLDNLSVWDIMHLAPLLTQKMCKWRNQGLYLQYAEQLILPVVIKIAVHSLLTQLREMKTDWRGLIAECLYDPTRPENPYWQMSLLPQRPEDIDPEWSTQAITLNQIWQRYSCQEIERYFPQFFQLQISRVLSGKVALKYLRGENKREVKRLLAIKNEIITANAMRQTCAGINAVLHRPARVGNNVFIISRLLSDPHCVLEPRLFCQVNEKCEGETRKRHIPAFPILIHFLWFLGDLFKNSPWEIGDIKEGNFKLHAAGNWQLVDYGGHFPQNLQQDGHETLLGSIDYASYALFRVLNDSFTPKLLQQANSKNSRWFSAIKTIVRMLSGRGADSLRGTDLNQMLFKDFSGYHAQIFSRLLDLVLYDKDSPYHFARFSLLKEDVADLFTNDDCGVETALRRFLFIIGLTLTGECAWSLLDKQMQKNMILHCCAQAIPHSSWEIKQQWGKFILVESSTEVSAADRKGLHPIEARKLLKIMFPGLEDSFAAQKNTHRQRERILQTLALLGALKYNNWGTTMRLADFSQNLRRYCTFILQAPWLNSQYLDKITQYRIALKYYVTASYRNHLQRIARKSAPALATLPMPQITSEMFPLETSWQLREQLLAILQNPLRLESLQRLLDQLLVWERLCFHQYLFGDISRHTASSIDLDRVRALFLERWALLHYARRENRIAIVEAALKSGWIQGTTDKHIEQLYIMADCNDEKQAMALLFSEFIRSRKDIEEQNIVDNVQEWEDLRCDCCRKLQQHPFFPDHLQDTSWTLNDLSSLLPDGEFFTKNPQFTSLAGYKLWQNWKRVYCCEQQFPGIIITCSEQLLKWFEEFIKYAWDSILAKLAECGLLWTNALKIPASWHQSLEYIDACRKFVSQTSCHPITKQMQNILAQAQPQNHLHILVQVLRIANYLQQQMHTMQQQILHSPLCIDYHKTGDESCHLEKKLQKLCVAGEDNFAVQMLIQQIRHLHVDKLKNTYGGIYSYYQELSALMPEIEKWFSFSATYSLPTLEKQSFPEKESFTVIDSNFSSKLIYLWEGDQLQNRIARHLGLCDNEGFALSYEERSSIAFLLQKFHDESGLHIQRVEEYGETTSYIYELLKKSTDDFRNLPEYLRDIRQIAGAKLQKIDLREMQHRFFAMVPAQAQPPHFAGSALLEAIAYQMAIDSGVIPGHTRQQIMQQLNWEWTTLSEQLMDFQQQYHEYRRFLENLSLLQLEDISNSWLQTTQRQWQTARNLFEDYLQIAKTIIERNKDHCPWQWSFLLKKYENRFLQFLFPGVVDEQLRAIYLQIFAFSPLPPAKDIQDFMQACHLFQLSEHQKRHLQTLLTDTPYPDNWQQARQFLQFSCWTPAERQVHTAISTSNLSPRSKNALWEEYLTTRCQLKIEQRIRGNSQLVEFLQTATSSKQIQQHLVFEIWLNRFQNHVEESMLSQFATAFTTLPPEKQQVIYQAMEQRSAKSDHMAFFSWLVQDQLLFPKLKALDPGRFHKKASEDIITLLTKHSNQVPLQLEFLLLATIKQKTEAQWAPQKLLAHLYNLIVKSQGTLE